MNEYTRSNKVQNIKPHVDRQPQMRVCRAVKLPQHEKLIFSPSTEISARWEKLICFKYIRKIKLLIHYNELYE